jgi:predicted ATPase
LLQACAALADSLLRACPRLKILASSREPLGIDGEAVLAVPSLPFPAAGQMPPIEELAAYPAVRLFIDRARLVLPNYQLAPDNAAAIARICQRLDGIPLALEMAAARMNLLGADQLADRLDDAFRLLTGGSRAALPRQQTLRATLDWSYKLLDDSQRLLLQRLSVFAGGCTLEAAEAICAGDGLEAGEVLDVLGALVTKSMVIAEHTPGEAARYHLLETVRQYAREKLNDAGETARLHNRHLDYFLAFAEDAFPRLQAPEGPAWRDKVAAERDNWRQAVEWSFSGDPSQIEAGPRLVIAVMYGPWRWNSEEVDWRLRGIELCRRRPDISPRLHIKLLEHASALSESEKDALSFAIQAVEIARNLGVDGRETLMWCLFQLARVVTGGEDRFERVNAAMAEAESILEAITPGYYPPEEELRVRGHFTQQRADFANQQGQHLEARRYAAESIRLYEASGSGWFAIMGHTHFGAASEALGEYAEAEAHFLAALNLTGQVAGWDSAYLLRQLARIDLRQGRLEQALEHCRASTRQAQHSSHPIIMASNVGLLADIRARQGQPLRAASLSGASAAMFVRLKRPPWEDTTLDTLLPGWREGPLQADIAEAYEAGQAMSTKDAVALALEDNADSSADG